MLFKNYSVYVDRNSYGFRVLSEEKATILAEAYEHDTKFPLLKVTSFDELRDCVYEFADCPDPTAVEIFVREDHNLNTDQPGFYLEPYIMFFNQDKAAREVQATRRSDIHSGDCRWLETAPIVREGKLTVTNTQRIAYVDLERLIFELWNDICSIVDRLMEKEYSKYLELKAAKKEYDAALEAVKVYQEGTWQERTGQTPKTLRINNNYFTPDQMKEYAEL